MKRRKIFSLTGARADYGRLKSVWEAVQKHPRLELLTAVTGMHLMEKYGYTFNNILSDGYKPDFQVDIFREKEDGVSMTKALGRGILAFTDIITDCNPDIILVQGD